MRPRFPLPAKIVLWFFANLLLIGVAAVGFVEFEFHLGPETLLGGRAGRRVDALADLVTGELATQPRSQWDAVLQRAGNLYGLNLLIVTPDGHTEAGAQITLPPEVIGRLFRPRPPQPPGAPGNPGAQGPGPGGSDQSPLVELEPSAIQGLPGPNGPPGPPDPPRDRRMLHTDNPGRYWLLLPLDQPGPPGSAGPGGPGGPMRLPPLTLVAVSQSIGLGGLVIDLTPWLAAAAGVIIFSVLFWLPLVKGITGSIRDMTGATTRIAEGQFDLPVRDTRSDELGQLARSINRMAERLAGFVNGQKRFLGDIAHELCSPLARAQVALGILEQKAGGAQLADLREEIQQMSSLVNELLSFSKASLAAGRIKLQSIPLHEVIREAIERENLPDSAFQSTIANDLWVAAEPELLRRAISNLLRNGVKYAGGAGPIELSADRAGNEVILTVSDSGPGVPQESLAQIFDPFYRIDASRSRETGGTGLGLAIVKTCIESCGGRVTCDNRQPHGLSVVITLAAG